MDLVSLTTMVEVVKGKDLVLFFLIDSGPRHQPRGSSSWILVTFMFIIWQNINQINKQP